MQPGRCGQRSGQRSAGPTQVPFILSEVISSHNEVVPLRLFVCFGFCVVVAICFALLGGEAGFPRADGIVSGEARIVDGDGILIFSIPGRGVTFTRVLNQGTRERDENGDILTPRREEKR